MKFLITNFGVSAADIKVMERNEIVSRDMIVPNRYLEVELKPNQHVVIKPKE